MKFRKYSLFSIVFLLAASTTTYVFSQQEGGQDDDPYVRMKYYDAFNQKEVHEKYKELLQKFGCYRNIIQATNDSIAIMMPDFDPRTPADRSTRLNTVWKTAKTVGSYAYDCIPCLWRDPQPREQGANLDQRQIEANENQRQIREYLAACHDQLESARRSAITRPVVRAAVMTGLLWSCALPASYFLSKDAQPQSDSYLQEQNVDSFGAKESITFAALNTAFILKDAIPALFNLISSPKNDLEELEERFAANQCFIPKALWPKIIEQFNVARSNKYHQQEAVEYIKFALDLTTYAPTPPLDPALNKETIKEQLESRIDNFFQDYQIDSAETKNDIKTLKINIKKFVDMLFDENDSCEAPKYLFLLGNPGIGKTHFMDQLETWLADLIPHSVYYTQFRDIDSVGKLEGSKQEPGIMLECLRHQLAAKKHGSVLFLDEAVCLHQQNLIDAAKRVFNGNQSEISTTYFGNGSEGQGVSINIPPMLICVAGNNPITDTALLDRFATIHFPIPQKETLLQYAIKKAQQSEFFRKNPIEMSCLEPALLNWLTTKKITSFRQADGVETFLESDECRKELEQSSLM